MSDKKLRDALIGFGMLCVYSVALSALYFLCSAHMQEISPAQYIASSSAFNFPR